MNKLFGLAAVIMITASPAFAQSVNGTVTQIDVAQGMLAINHGPIKNLGMMGMTMIFRAADLAMLKDIKAGDKIKFEADSVNGQLTVTKLEKTK